MNQEITIVVQGYILMSVIGIVAVLLFCFRYPKTIVYSAISFLEKWMMITFYAWLAFVSLLTILTWFGKVSLDDKLIMILFVFVGAFYFLTALVFVLTFVFGNGDAQEDR